MFPLEYQLSRKMYDLSSTLQQMRFIKALVLYRPRHELKRPRAKQVSILIINAKSKRNNTNMPKHTATKDVLLISTVVRDTYMNTSLALCTYITRVPIFTKLKNKENVVNPIAIMWWIAISRKSDLLRSGIKTTSSEQRYPHAIRYHLM